MIKENDIAFLDSSTETSSSVYHHHLYKKRLRRVDLYTMTNQELARYKAIIIPNSIDEEYLYKNKNMISSFLTEKKVLVSFAQIFKRWLPGNTLYQQSQIAINERTITFDKANCIFKGVTEYDLNYRKGVKGFFSRGFFTPPKGTEIVLKDNNDNVVVYIDRKTTNGTILAGAGTDLLGFGLQETTTARRIGLQLLDWIDNEEKRLKQ